MKVERIDARNYTIKETGHGLMKILAALGGATAVSDVEIDHLVEVAYAEYNYKPFDGYGCGIDDVSEATLLSDGRIMACIASHEFADTFASHNDIKTSYYILTPKPGYE